MFKRIPVAYSVPSSQSNMPLLINPSLMTGWSSITAAEGQSSRFYADEAKTVELAREYVSPTEIWVKVGTVTSSTEIFCDIDGVRSDYAVTDTYGRNAVWTGYDLVSHAGGGTDSTGNGYTGTAMGGVTSGGISGKVGNATLYDGTNDYFDLGNILSYNGNVNLYLSIWVKRNGTLPDFWSPLSKQGGNAATDQYEIRGANSTVKNNPVMQVVTTGGVYRSSSTTIGGSITLNDSTWYLLHGQIEASSGVISLRVNASLANSQTFSGYSIQNTSSPLKIGVQTVSVNRFWKGDLDEARVGQTIRTADWITTEYNNQNNVGTFWGTVTDAGGAPANNSGFLLWL